MRLFGSLKELVSAVFRKDTKEITLQPNALVYNQNQDLRLPPATDGSGDLTADTLVGAAAQQTLTNKTIDGDNNTLQDVGISSLKTVLADANKALVRNASGAVTSALIGNSNVGTGIDAEKIADGSVSNAEFQYLGNVTSDLQNQLNNKQPLDSDLTAIAALSANGLIARTGAGTAEARTLTAGSSKVAVTNGDGVSGNPTVDVTEANLSLNNISGTLNLNKGGTGQVTKDAAFSALSPTTTVGDLIVHKSLGGAANRLPVGPANYVLKSDGTEPGYGLITNSNVDNAAAIVDTKLATISTAGKVSGSAITSGTIGGSTVINTSGHITTTGNVNANNITVDNGSISTGVNKSVNIFNDATNTTIGTVASSSFYNIGTGSTTSGNTKTVNIGNGGLAGSTTNVAIGSAAGSGTITLAENVTLGKLTTAGAVQVDSSGVTSSGILPASSGGTGVASTATYPTTGIVVTRDSTDTLLNKTTVSSTAAATGALKLPTGNSTTERPTGTASQLKGMVRYNDTDDTFEGYNELSGWSSLGGGGTIDRITQGSHGFVVGDVLYLNGSVYTKAIATSAAAAEVVGVVSRYIDSSTFELTLSGEVSGLSGLAVGETYFLSATTDGALTTTEPSTIGQVSVPVGVASSASTLYVAPKRGIIVGGTNARTQLSLANNTANTVLNVSAYDAGELTGWVYIVGTSSSRFQITIQFAKNAAGSDYNVAYQTVGDTPPAGFTVDYSSPNVRMTLPNVAGFSSAIFNYALNAPAVGATFPLAIDASNVTTGTVAAARLPQVSSSAQGAFPSLTSSLDNATATQLGLKQYLHGTNYNGGNAPTITAGTNITALGTTRGVFIPYQCQDGTWRLKFNIVAAVTATAGTVHQLLIAGVVTKNISGYSQQVAVGMSAGTGVSPHYGIFSENTGTLQVGFPSNATPTTLRFSGDVELESKPNWAY